MIPNEGFEFQPSMSGITKFLKQQTSQVSENYVVLIRGYAGAKNAAFPTGFAARVCFAR